MWSRVNGEKKAPRSLYTSILDRESVARVKRMLIRESVVLLRKLYVTVHRINGKMLKRTAVQETADIHVAPTRRYGVTDLQISYLGSVLRT
jgi:hypothetical protein